MTCSTADCENLAVAKGMCKRCYMREYMRGYQNKWRKKNKALARAQKTRDHTKNGKNRYINRRHRALAYALDVALKKYGMTHEEYLKMFEAQGGACSICGRTPPKNRLAIDHCHKTGRVRGLLCGACNTGLGLFRDDVALLRAATQYLQS